MLSKFKVVRGCGRFSPSKRGFTLVELMCAIGIASICAVSLFAAYSNGFAILRVSRDDLRATQILTQKTEAVRLFTWMELSNCPVSFQDYFNPSGVTNGNAGTTYYGTISPFGDPTNIPSTASYRANIHLITINLNWTNAVNGVSVGHTRQMQTLLASQGMQTYIYGKGP